MAWGIWAHGMRLDNFWGIWHALGSTNGPKGWLFWVWNHRCWKSSYIYTFKRYTQTARKQWANGFLTNTHSEQYWTESHTMLFWPWIWTIIQQKRWNPTTFFPQTCGSTTNIHVLQNHHLPFSGPISWSAIPWAQYDSITTQSCASLRVLSRLFHPSQGK
jgi:hypothetical protein